MDSHHGKCHLEMFFIDMGFTHPITHIFDSRCRGLIRCWPAKRRKHWARQAAQTLGPPSSVNTGPAKRRKHWACQAAKTLGSPSGVNTRLTKRDKSWFFIPPSGLRPPSPASGGRDFSVQNLRLATRQAALVLGSAKERRSFASFFCCFLLRARVVGVVGFDKGLRVEVGIDLCGGEIFMAKHFLHGADVA